GQHADRKNGRRARRRGGHFRRQDRGQQRVIQGCAGLRRQAGFAGIQRYCLRQRPETDDVGWARSCRAELQEEVALTTLLLAGLLRGGFGSSVQDSRAPGSEPAILFAQSGTVKSAGQPIPGATVRATQGERSLVTLTDDNGAFRFQGMTPGAWVIEADMFGFDPLRREVQIASTPTNLDLTLQLSARVAASAPPGSQPESAAPPDFPPQPAEPTAIAEFAPQVSADSSNESFLVNGTVSQALRTNQADFEGFGPGGFGPGGFPGGDAQFGGPGGPGGPPGDQPPGLAGGGPAGRGGGGGRGGRGGGGAPGFAGGGRGGGFGGGGFRGGGGRGGRGGRGGQQNAAFIGNRARRSANQSRLQMFFTARNAAFDARPFSLNGQVQPKSSYANNRYGLNVGGPVIIPKLLDLSQKLNFTVTYNGTLARNPYDATATLPTAAERSGIFTGRNTIYDPNSCVAGLGCQPFAGNQIPLASISPIAQGLLRYIPLPIYGGLIQNYRYTTSVPANSQNVNTRIQWTVDQMNRISFTSN